MAQLMPLPLTVSCFSKIQIGFTFLVLALWLTQIVLDKGPLNVCACVSVRACVILSGVLKSHSCLCVASQVLVLNTFVIMALHTVI